MLKTLTISILIVCLFGSSQLYGQEIVKPLEKNETFLRADSIVKIGKTAEARILYLQARESFERQQLWPPFVDITIAFAKTYEGPEDYQIGIVQLEDALKKMAFDINGQAHFRALLYEQMGTLYHSAFELKSAIEARKKQLEMLNLAYDLDSNWAFVKAYCLIGDNLRNIEETEAALEYYLKAKATSTKLKNTNPVWTRATYRSIGFFYFQLGNYDAALKSFEKGLELALAHPQKNTYYIFDFYSSMALIYRYMGEFSQSLFYNEKMLSLLKTMPPNYDDWYFYVFLGENYMDLDQLDKALYYFNKALEATELDPSRLEGKIRTYIYFCCNYRLMKQYDKALSIIGIADSLLQIQTQKKENPLGIYHDQRGVSWHTAKVWEEIGNLQKAKYYYREMLEHYSNEGIKFCDIETLRDLAAIYEKENKLDSALLYNQKALIASCYSFNSSDPEKLPVPEDLRDNIDVYRVLQQKIQFAGKKSDNQYSLSLREQERTLEIVDLADLYHSSNLKKMNLLRGGKNSVIIDYSTQIYLQGFNLAYDFYQQTKAPLFMSKGFYYIQKMKAQRLWLTLLNSEASSFGNLPEVLLEKERDIMANIQYYETKVLEAQERGDSAAVTNYQNDYLFDYQVASRELVQRLETDYPEYYESKYNFIPETESSLQQVLTENELLIEYVFADSALFVFTLSQTEPLQVTKIPLSPETTEQVESLQKMLQNSAMLRQSSREKFIQTSYDLYQQFLQPIEAQVNQHQRLIIIGDGMTNYIPFEVLLRSDEVKPFKGLDYLIKQHEVSYHYSATLFAKARKKTSTKSTNIYAFAPVYDSEKDDNSMANAYTSKTIYSELRAYNADGSFAPLPESEKEVKAIFQLFTRKGIPGNTIAVRAAANEPALKTELAKPYQFIHIAGHSFADLENPKFSGIACYEEAVQDSTMQNDDGVLYTGEIYNISTQADLVTLSSCESGYGKLESTEGLLGLNRAFIYAGTPNVVFSLWKVYDKVNAELMVDFYQGVLDGKSYSESLRQAKLNLLNKEATAAPHFWSPYLLIGR